MTTRTDPRLDDIRARIDRLDARAQAAGSEARESMTEQVEGLRRQETSVRAAVRDAHHTRAGDAEEEDEVALLDSRLGSAEHALEAEPAEDTAAFTAAMRAHLAESRALIERLKAKAATKPGGPRDHVEATMRDLDATRQTAEATLHELNEVSDGRLREEKTSASRARAELDRKLEKARQKLV